MCKHGLALIDQGSSDQFLDLLKPEALAQASLVEHAHPAGGEPVRTLPLGYGLDGESRASDRRAPRLGEHTEAVLSEWLAD